MRSKTPVRADFDLRLGTEAVPAYWRPSFPCLLVRLADLPSDFGEPAGGVCRTIEDGFVGAWNLSHFASVTFMEPVTRLRQAIGDAFCWSTRGCFVAKLIRNNERLAESFRLNNAGIDGDTRARFLAEQYPDYDHRRDDIWSAANTQLIARRKQHGMAPEFSAIETALEAQDLLIRHQESGLEETENV